MKRRILRQLLVPTERCVSESDPVLLDGNDLSREVTIDKGSTSKEGVDSFQRSHCEGRGKRRSASWIERDERKGGRTGPDHELLQREDARNRSRESLKEIYRCKDGSSVENPSLNLGEEGKSSDGDEIGKNRRDKSTKEGDVLRATVDSEEMRKSITESLHKSK